jgi:hypothetical protein
VRADGHTDMTKRIVAFRNFANAPKQRACVAARITVAIHRTDISAVIQKRQAAGRAYRPASSCVLIR